jgi:Helix-turn-helix domain
MERSTTEDLVRRYQAGESIRAMACATGVPATTVHRRLVANGVELRPPGRQPAALERSMLPDISELPQFPEVGRRPGRLRASPRAGRRSTPQRGDRGPAASGASDYRVPVDEVLAGLQRGLAAFKADVQAPLELTDYELAVFTDAMAILAGKQPLVDASGNTRGVRLGSDGQPERF